MENIGFHKKKHGKIWEKNMYMEVFMEKSSKSMGINGSFSSHFKEHQRS